MAEYIEREAVLGKATYAGISDAQGIEYGCAEIIFTNDVKEIPAADVEPVVHASWVNAEEKPYIRKHFYKKVCSNCFREGQERWKRCPYCEAKMDGKEKQ